MTHFLFCQWHLGDNLASLNFLRKLSLAHPSDNFAYACQPQYLYQLREVVEDIPAIELIPLEECFSRSPLWLDTWKNSQHFYDRHPQKACYAKCYLDFFNVLARSMGYESPLKTPDDLWFDYPAIQQSECADAFIRTWGLQDGLDILVCNAPPKSAQLASWHGVNMFDALIAKLRTQHRVAKTNFSLADVPCTAILNMTLTDIGALSLKAKVIIGVANGPMWPTFNVWNRDIVKLRIAMTDEVVDLGHNTHTVNTVEAAENLLVSQGIL